MKSVLRKELHQTVVEPTSPNALLSGSDVLFTGREFFVGISQWTNTEGAVAVAATWPEYPCTPVKASFYSNNLCFELDLPYFGLFTIDTKSRSGKKNKLVNFLVVLELIQRLSGSKSAVQ